MTENAPSAAPARQDAGNTEKLWIDQVADKVLAAFPKAEIYTCAAGISPSGIVHFGNFRDVMTSLAVASELVARGKKARLLFSWDNYDRFRKVPAGVDPGFSRYLGYPLTEVPDPSGEFPSYARRYEAEFEESMRELGIPLEYRYQSVAYKSGRYAAQIAFALGNRRRIGEIIASFKTKKVGEDGAVVPDEELSPSYYPVVVYSRFSNTDKVEVLDYDGGTRLTYRCRVTGRSETIDFRETPVVKLPWKVDWPMRWGEEHVHFEPGGKDHATPGGSYDVSARIAREVFGIEPPVFQGYQFVGIQGISGKMSGSKGDAVSPATLLGIYEPALLKWLYLKRNPGASFNLAFDTEVFRQYDEFDREVQKVRDGQAMPTNRKILAFSGAFGGNGEAEPGALPPIPFRLAVALGQITQWNTEKLFALLEKTGSAYDRGSVERRLPKARTWLERYNPEETIRLLDQQNAGYIAAMGEGSRAQIRRLHGFLAGGGGAASDLENLVYDIPKHPGLSPEETKAAQKNFFKDVYRLLIDRETGPRLSTFLWAIDRDRACRLLDI